MTKEDVWNAKYIYDSAYHPTTGELVFMPGRMSFQGNFLKQIGSIFEKIKMSDSKAANSHFKVAYKL